MKDIQIKGIIPPVITPFHENGEPDLERYGELLEFLLQHVHGLYPLGTYGSGPLMPKEMRIRTAEYVIKKVDGRVPVILHVGAADTDTAVELARAAESAGADAVAGIVPFYYGYDDRCLYEHFLRIMEAVEIPFYVYNNPGMGNNTVKPAVLKKLADKGLKGVKDSSFDILTFYGYMRAVDREDFDFVIGTEALFVAAMVAGGKACVSGVANTFPDLMAELYEATQARDWARAMELQQKVNRIRDIMHLSNSIMSMHTMLKLRGIDPGRPRRPLRPLDAETEAKIKSGLEELDLL